MPTERAHMNVVQVPDGSAYGIGGNSSGLALNNSGSVAGYSFLPGSGSFHAFISRNGLMSDLGTQVTILEARTHPGGRVRTLREPFSE